MRDNRFDNLKAFLIFSVVLCHLFELFPGTLKYRIYIFIYSFHMPMFVFISGYFAKFNIKSILYKMLYPYVIFQILYCLFTENRIQFLSPHWILWYLFCLMLWSLTLKISDKNLYIALAISLVLAVITGYSDKIGKVLSLARFFSFYPFFLLGYIARKKEWLSFKIKYSEFKGVVFMILAFSLTYFILPYIKTSWFYHSEPFIKTGETAVLRVILLIIALLWCIGFLLITPKKRIPIISNIGKHSICIFLVHGLVVQYFSLYCNPFTLSELQNLCLAIAIAAILWILLGNKYTYKVLSPLIVFPLQNAKNVVKYIINKNRPR